ncbi:MAG: hypothetical protein NXI32_06950 [bacterium]|nr:hypothetical protein [bacterium]
MISTVSSLRFVFNQCGTVRRTVFSADQHLSHHGASRPKTGFAALTCLLAGWLVCGLTLPVAKLHAQPGKVWEFSPYEVEIWYTFAPTADLSSTASQTFIRELEQELRRSFRAAWQIRSRPLSPDWASIVQDRFEQFTIADLARNELLVVVSTKAESAKSVRTVEAAVEQLSEVAVTRAQRERLSELAGLASVSPDSFAQRFLDLCTAVYEDEAEIQAGINSGEIVAAVLSRSSIPAVQEQARVLISSLPWQTETVLRDRDKVFFLVVEGSGDLFSIKARELDCPMQYMGPSFATETANWPFASRVAAATITQAFAPTARVESAESSSAELRQKAGGLIMSESNPASIRIGDVLQPIVRRDDRNGIPTLLQPLSWTYAAIADKSEDGVRLTANVYTYSGGAGLRGRQNRRTQRVLLRVRPQTEHTDVRVVVRGTDTPQSGCFVYRRDLLNDDFELLGRTDWRGQIRIPVPQENASFYPDALKRQLLIAKREALQRAAQEAAKAPEADSAEASDDASQTDSSGDAAVTAAAEISEASEESLDAAARNQTISLKYPLMELYVKNGDTVLAKLPLVPGLQPLEIAELPDDSRRLQAEAFVKGFQGEILDLVGLRNLLAARITIYLKEGQVDAASQLLEQMRQLPTYNEMSDRLETIQRSMLDEQQGAIPLVAKNRIDRMFQVTRNMLQKYLQDNLAEQAESSVKRAKSGSAGES